MSLVINTGLNRSGNCVIELSPILYNKLIDECKMIVDEHKQRFTAQGAAPTIEETMNWAVIFQISQQPKLL